MPLTALKTVEKKTNNTYEGNMVFTVSDHSYVEVKKSAITSEIRKLLRKLSDFDTEKNLEGYRLNFPNSVNINTELKYLVQKFNIQALSFSF